MQRTAWRTTATAATVLPYAMSQSEAEKRIMNRKRRDDTVYYDPQIVTVVRDQFGIPIVFVHARRVAFDGGHLGMRREVAKALEIAPESVKLLERVERVPVDPADVPRLLALPALCMSSSAHASGAG